MSDELPQRWTAATVRPDIWVDPDDDPRQGAAQLTDERSTLFDYLRAHRLTLELKCEGLDAGQLARRSVPPSTLSLLGLVRHMADVERYWFQRVMSGEPVADLYPDESEWEVEAADAATVETAWTDWREAVAAAERVTAANDLSHVGTTRHGEKVQLREVLVHMIEEYARHCGHADLLRERIDGRTGH